jgi:two-component system, OmpR family, response regulator MprA
VPHRRASILIIDDDPAIRDLANQALQDEGYRAITLASHAEAVRHLAAFRFNLVLADTAGAAKTDAWSALEEVRAAAGETPVLIFSAHHPSVFTGYAERGFAGVIAKPFDLDELLTTVQATLTWRDKDRTGQ